MSDYIRTFNRYELKYVLHYLEARELLDRIGCHVRADPHAGRDGFYKIVSRYYDSPDLSCYWEKTDGEKWRRKVRVRTYGEKADEAFLEVKQRYNLTVQKRRCRASLEEIEAVMSDMELGRYESDGSEPVYDEVFNLRRRFQLDPKLIVSYNRTAFFDRYKNDLRITLDRNIRCRHMNLGLKEQRTGGAWVIPPTYLILEVKFNEVIPRWLCSCLNSLDLLGNRFSKYARGIERFALENRPSAFGLWPRHEQRPGEGNRQMERAADEMPARLQADALPLELNDEPATTAYQADSDAISTSSLVATESKS